VIAAALVSLLVVQPFAAPPDLLAVPGVPAGPFPAPLPQWTAPLQPAAPGHFGELELAPIFGEGSPEAAAVAAYLAGRYPEAVAKLAHATMPEASYVRALALLELDRYGEAERALEGLEDKLPALADRVHFLRGEALAGEGRRADALAAWEAVDDGSLLAPEARLGRARVASAAGDRAAALDALAPLLTVSAPADLSRSDFGATALLLAGRLRAGGPRPDLPAARRDLLACWTAHPLAPEAADCLVAARGLAMPFGVPPGPDEVLQRAENLLEQNRNATAITLLEPLAAAVRGAAADAPMACRIRAALGRAYRKERSYAKAVELLQPVVAGCSDPALKARALYVLAGATAIGGDREAGIALYRRLAHDFPSHSYADDALLAAADLLDRSGREAEARDALDELVRTHPEGDQRGEARFRLAWLARRAGAVDAAIEALAAIEREAGPEDGYDRARAMYWRARLLAARGPSTAAQAQALWREVASRFGTDYYGLLSRARLAEAGASLPLPQLASGPLGPVTPAVARDPAPAAGYDAGPLAGDRHFQAGLLLHRLGFGHAAAEELAAVPPALLKSGDATDPVLLVADVLDRCGDHRAAHQLLRTRARAAFRRPPDADNARAWRIAYPPAYREDVVRSAQAAAIPPDLLQALMREESALDPRVISPAGAVGLTQLMLPTAQSVAARLKLRRPARSDLMEPALNLRLGAQYLGELVRRYDGEVALALAAYNAGGGALGRWLEGRGDAPLDAFVEEIPVDETRGYVKRVLRSYATYRTLYGPAETATAGEILRVAGK
jgi:soluble lytic murein transglycosylase